MKDHKWIYTLTIFLAVTVFLVVANLALAYEGRSSNEKGVRVNVDPVALSLGQSAVFAIRLNTHSVPLEQDLAAVSELRDDQGRTYKPLRWEGSQPGGHHRSGKLIFPEIDGPVGALTLVIRDIGGIERTFEWQLE